MRIMRRPALALCIACLVACHSEPGPSQPLRGMTTGEAFGSSCKSAHTSMEHDLMAWDPASRLNLKSLRTQGVVAVRYEAKGCDVAIELLPRCIGPAGKYAFAPYSANERRVAHNADELFAQLPLGAARLAGSVSGAHALRTDYMLAGLYSLPPGASVTSADVSGVDCARATHVVSAVYVGGFAMGAGESRTIDASATFFGAGAGIRDRAGVEVLADEGNAEACKVSQRDGKESSQCDVPLRLGLARIVPAAPPAPTVPATPVKDAMALLSSQLQGYEVKVGVRKARLTVSLPHGYDSRDAVWLWEKPRLALRRVAEVIAANPSLASRDYQVVGHTHNGAPPSKFKSNEELSLARARRALAFLVGPRDGATPGAGLPKEHWAAMGNGEIDFVAGTLAMQTPEDRSKNERLEIVMVPTPAEATELHGLEHEAP